MSLKKIVIKNNSLRIGLLLTLFTLPIISQAEEWYAMSRHGEYWPEERKMIGDGYKDIQLSFKEIADIWGEPE